MTKGKREAELLILTQKMIQTPSYSGQENRVADIIKKFCDEHNFTNFLFDKYGSCICHIKGSKPGPKVLFDGHMDTVPVIDETQWDHDPFGAEIVGGRMYGRGASDMKGALCAMLTAAAYYAEDSDNNFSGDIYVAGVVHEECFEGVAAREISAYVKPDYVIIGEASQLNMKIGQRGRAEIVVETFGIPAHSASPDMGVNAVYKMCKVIEEIKKLAPPHHDVLGDGILELVDVKSSPYPGSSVVPDYCRATFDRRLLTGETKESVLAPLQKIINCLQKDDQHFKAKVYYSVGKEKCWTGEIIEAERFFPGWLFDKNEDWIQSIYKEMKAIGLNPAITNYDFCTNASHYAGEAGIRTIGIGPSLETLAHTINEYIAIDQLNMATESYYSVMKSLLK